MICNQPKDGWKSECRSDVCLDLRRSYDEERGVRGKFEGIRFGSIPGGTRSLAKKMDYTREFNRDMHLYREARRAGEQPDGISKKKISDTRRRVEQQAELKEKGVYHGA